MSDSLVILIKQLINGIQLGSVYALVALGYTMVYGIIKLINFAHGDFIMVGGYIIVFFNSLFDKHGNFYLAVSNSCCYIMCSFRYVC